MAVLVEVTSVESTLISITVPLVILLIVLCLQLLSECFLIYKPETALDAGNPTVKVLEPPQASVATALICQGLEALPDEPTLKPVEAIVVPSEYVTDKLL